MTNLSHPFLADQAVAPDPGPSHCCGPFRVPGHRHLDWSRLEAVARDWLREWLIVHGGDRRTGELRRLLEADLRKLEISGELPVPGATEIGATVWSKSPCSSPTPREVAAAQWRVVMRQLTARPYLALAFLRCNRPDLYDRITGAVQAEAVSPPSPETETTECSPVMKASARISRTEANVRAWEHLMAHPAASARELKDVIGCSLGLVPRLPAWKAVMEERKKWRKPNAPRHVAFTDRMQAVTGRRDDDPAEKVATDELFGRLIKQADPDEQARLRNLTPKERCQLAEEYASQLDDVEPSPLDDDPPDSPPRRVRARPKL